MRIEQLGAFGYGAQISRSRQREESENAEKKNGKAKFSRKDSFTLSPDAAKASSLKEVKKRVKNNFYSSDVVNEDLSEVFTKLFDR